MSSLNSCFHQERVMKLAHRFARLCLGLATIAAASSSLAADWPQWRGPERTGISQETGLLPEWPAEGPKLLWQRTDVGGGYSTPSIVGDRIYLLGNEGNDNEYVQCLRVGDGEVIWKTTIGKVGHPDQRPPYPGSRSTATVDGDALYVLGSDGDLACLDAESGSIRWSKNVRADYGGKYGEWAYSESPLVDGDVVVCTPGGEEATMLALNKRNGEVVWRSAIPGGDEAGYASIIVVETDGVKQYVQFMAKGVVGVAAETGKFLWRYEKTAEGSPANIPTPVEDGGYVYTAAGRSGGGLVRLKYDGSQFDVEEVYFTPSLPKAIGGTVKVGDYLYGTSRGLLCVTFTSGEVKWEDRSIGASSICFADGNLYLHGENGDVALVEATPEQYVEKGRFTPPNPPDRGNSKAWAYPVVANGRLYIRELGSLWCYDVQAN
jgi:outer membrane protein assembly factor BamB